MFGQLPNYAKNLIHFIILHKNSKQIVDENILCESFQIEMKHLLQVIWFNLRVEPVGYVDGLPVAARAPEALHTNIQVG